jgi:hypothetical protein
MSLIVVLPGSRMARGSILIAQTSSINRSPTRTMAFAGAISPSRSKVKKVDEGNKAFASHGGELGVAGRDLGWFDGDESEMNEERRKMKFLKKGFLSCNVKPNGMPRDKSRNIRGASA